MTTPSQVGADIAATMARVGKVLDLSIREAMKEAGKVGRAEVEKSGRRFTGGDLRFSNMGNARIGTRLRHVEDGVFVNARGPWGMLEPGAQYHVITSKHGDGSRRGRAMRATSGGFGPVLGSRIGGGKRAVLNINGNFRRYARHPGTRNTRAWSLGAKSAFSKLGLEVPKRISDAVEEAFDG